MALEYVVSHWTLPCFDDIRVLLQSQPYGQVAGAGCRLGGLRKQQVLVALGPKRFVTVLCGKQGLSDKKALPELVFHVRNGKQLGDLSANQESAFKRDTGSLRKIGRHILLFDPVG